MFMVLVCRCARLALGLYMDHGIGMGICMHHAIEDDPQISIRRRSAE